MRYLRELKDGEAVTAVYLCKQKTSGKSKFDKTYYSLVLQDKTGTMDCKIWDLTNDIEHFEANDYIKVEGVVSTYRDALQMTVKKARRANEGEYDPGDYMPVTRKNIDEMYSQLTALIGTVQNQYLRALLDSFFVEDEDFIKRFKVHSAAKSIHHGFIGGLLQHSLAVAKLCDFMAVQYPEMNRDLVVTAAICHDIGKLEELAPFPVNDYTDDGNFLGHIVIGAMMVRDRIANIPGFPGMLEQELLHCILSHHGELEYGSPKKPELLEAVALSFADNTDAKLETFIEAIGAQEGAKGWLGYNKMFEANIRKTE